MRNNIEVTVSKDELLLKLKENRDIHIKEYKEMYDNYQKEVIKELQLMVKEAKKGNIKTSLLLPAPNNHTSEYDEVIGMIEMSVDEYFKIDSNQYKKYVMNQWDWSGNFNMMKATYLGS